MSIKQNVERAKADYDEVYEKGKQAEYDAFWDEYQYVINGISQRTGCAYMFAYSGWNDKTFKPKYSMPYISNASNMFNTCGVTDLKGVLEKQGVVFDFSKATILSQALAYSKITRFPKIDSRGAIALSSAFYESTALEEVHIILKDDGTQTFSHTFYNCKSLSSLTVEGVIGTNGLTLQYSSKLSKASIENIIACLSTTTSGLSVTFSQTAVNNAFTTDEWNTLIATKSNWTISLV